jgi:hypothetical protein
MSSLGGAVRRGTAKKERSKKRLNLKIKCRNCKEDADMYGCTCDCILTKKRCKCPVLGDFSKSYSPFRKNVINRSFDLTSNYHMR